MADETAAIDLAPRGAWLTQKRLDLEGRPGLAQVADAENMPFPAHTFDAVYSFGVLHHTDHPERAVAEMWRVMRPGGKFMVALYHKHSLFAAHKAIEYAVRLRWRSQTWRDFLSELEFGAAELTHPRSCVSTAAGPPRNCSHSFTRCRWLSTIRRSAAASCRDGSGPSAGMSS